MGLYEKIKILSERKKISIRKLEETLGYGNGTIRRWEKQTPGVDKLEAVADYFDVSVDYLLGRENKVTSVDLLEDDIVFSFDGKEVSPEEIRAAIAVIKAARGE